MFLSDQFSSVLPDYECSFHQIFLISASTVHSGNTCELLCDNLLAIQDKFAAFSPAKSCCRSDGMCVVVSKFLRSSCHSPCTHKKVFQFLSCVSNQFFSRQELRGILQEFQLVAFLVHVMCKWFRVASSFRILVEVQLPAQHGKRCGGCSKTNLDVLVGALKGQISFKRRLKLLNFTWHSFRSSFFL